MIQQANKSRDRRINKPCIQRIESWLTERSQTVVTNGACSTPTKVKSRVPQGTVLGPLMFLLYINDIGDQIDGHMGLFADDSALYGVVGSIQDAQSLQRDLDNLNDWAHKWQMSFNADKCSILRIYRCHNPIDYQYKIGGQELTTVQHHPYLGVELNRKFRLYLFRLMRNYKYFMRACVCFVKQYKLRNQA